MYRQVTTMAKQESPDSTVDEWLLHAWMDTFKALMDDAITEHGFDADEHEDDEATERRNGEFFGSLFAAVGIVVLKAMDEALEAMRNPSPSSQLAANQSCGSWLYEASQGFHIFYSWG
jgi:hypothetical protein